MKINRISYNSDDTNLIDRFIEQLIENSIFEQLNCSNAEKLKLRTYNYLQTNENHNVNLSEEDFNYVKSMYRILPSEHKQPGYSNASTNGDCSSI